VGFGATARCERLCQKFDFIDQVIDRREHELDRCFIDESAVPDFLIDSGNDDPGATGHSGKRGRKRFAQLRLGTYSPEQAR